MNCLTSKSEYPATGIKKMKFFGKPLVVDFDMLGLIIYPANNGTAKDFEIMYTGGIKSTYPDGTMSFPNKPFFIFSIDDGKPMLSIPVMVIPCNLTPFTGFSNNSLNPTITNGYKTPLSLKKGMVIKGAIEYPIQAVPLPSGQGNSFTVHFIGK